MTLIGLSFWKIDKLAMRKEPILDQRVFEGSVVPKGTDTPKEPEKREPIKKEPCVGLCQVNDKTPPDKKDGEGTGTSPSTGRLGRLDGDEEAPDVERIPRVVGDCLECVDDKVTFEKPKEKKDDPLPVKQELMRGLRTAGSDDIYLPESMVSRLHAQGIGSFAVVLKVCVDRDGGAPSAVSVARSSGFDDVDAFITATVEREWRYQPYSVNGEKIPVCFTVQLDYQIVD
jgi:outer membrane biosynthesis protein TonB